MTALSKTIRPVGGYGMFAERGFHGMRSSHMPVFAAEGSEGGGDNGAAELEAARAQYPPASA